ncbi:protein of unknown function [Maribacter orientalis]|uniref:DUF4296 domain-containing protein n=1 Tax=Maribacter orientalis TaxID=228957 RepID=A0A1H7KG80_9FLAO|nr:DUF4296 domain-containing protein [Maribacter orientalis]SEK85506.1 protein of unknown function [Maribacter orientalis]|tara:strand:- start:538 stop:960 length:423 start_codon:yes stop_codon:yes gene_type:complete
MRYSLSFMLVMLLLFSCAEELIEKPENLIPQDKMVLIFKEMAIVNAAKGTNIGKLKDNGIEPTTYIFEKFEIDSAQFVDSDRYYASKPLLYETMYKDVESRLENQRIQLEAMKKEKDSLNLVKKASSKDLKSTDKVSDTL